MSVRILCPRFNWVCYCCWVLGVLQMFWMLIPYQIYDLKIYPPILWVYEIQLFYLHFCCCAFGVISKKHCLILSYGVLSSGSSHIKVWFILLNFSSTCSIYRYVYICIYLSFDLLGLHLWHMEVPRLGVQSELQLPAYTTATTTQGLSRICDLQHSSDWSRTLNPQDEARDQIHILTETTSGP